MITRRQGLAAALLTPWMSSIRAASLDTSPGAPLNDMERALHAIERLGFGPRAADAETIQAKGAGPWLKDFLSAQLQGARIDLPPGLSDRLAAEDTSKLDQGELFERFRRAQQLERERKQSLKDGQDTETDKGDKGPNPRRELVRPVALQASEQRLLRALASPAQLEEVLVDFWFNHFNVFAGKGPVSVWVGSYEREAIRPNVFGSFRTMLGATAKHPAMLFYLDNAQSVAANWHPRGRAANRNPNRPTGLNENYAREVMELHTLGVDGGYTQHDVTELARMLTGWTYDPKPGWGGGSSLFRFVDERHDQGRKQWLGRSVAPAGQAEGEMALDVLAAHPNTARHIGYQLAQAFVADDPPPALVQRLADRFLAAKDSGTQLRDVMQTLVQSDEFWSRAAFRAKFKSPYRYVLSSLRVLAPPDHESLPADVQPLLGVLNQAGMPLYGSVTPDGYKNTAVAWQNPEALTQRVQFAQTVNKRFAKREALATNESDQVLATLGPLLSATTVSAVRSATPDMRTTLLLGSPDFMRF
ncbi:MAG: DUF1800 domain-containing protein [Paucibacter sp.]|nr:DUF1800 domain-containing protein [Roseateles sp.]